MVVGSGEVSFLDFLTVMARKMKESDLKDEMLTLFRGDLRHRSFLHETNNDQGYNYILHYV